MLGSPQKNKILRAAIVVGVVVVAAILITVATTNRKVYEEPVQEPPPVLVEESAGEESAAAEPYPAGKLIITKEREVYADGQLRLYIPKMEFEGDVYDGTEDETLEKGVGLFEYAQLPGDIQRNDNVSIAGHRDIHGREFYNIDKLEEGDRIYLTYEDVLYTYQAEEIFVTEPTDWDPIRVKDYPCVTLQSCTPIGVASHRIFVVGRLIAVSEGEGFPAGE